MGQHRVGLRWSLVSVYLDAPASAQGLRLSLESNDTAEVKSCFAAGRGLLEGVPSVTRWVCLPSGSSLTIRASCASGPCALHFSWKPRTTDKPNKPLLLICKLPPAQVSWARQTQGVGLGLGFTLLSSLMESHQLSPGFPLPLVHHPSHGQVGFVPRTTLL